MTIELIEVFSSDTYRDIPLQDKSAGTLMASQFSTYESRIKTFSKWPYAQVPFPDRVHKTDHSLRHVGDRWHLFGAGDAASRDTGGACFTGRPDCIAASQNFHCFICSV